MKLRAMNLFMRQVAGVSGIALLGSAIALTAFSQEDHLRLAEPEGDLRIETTEDTRSSLTSHPPAPSPAEDPVIAMRMALEDSPVIALGSRFAEIDHVPVILTSEDTEPYIISTLNIKCARGYNGERLTIRWQRHSEVSSTIARSTQQILVAGSFHEDGFLVPAVLGKWDEQEHILTVGTTEVKLSDVLSGC